VIRLESLVVAIGKLNGAWDDPDSKAFQLCNPLLLKTYRPEKKCDGEHTRIFTSVMGGFKAGIADIQAKCSGKNNRLGPENSLADILAVFGFKNEQTVRKTILFLRRANRDESIHANTPVAWFLQKDSSLSEQVLTEQGETNAA
jgi:hypothetical protein